MAKRKTKANTKADLDRMNETGNRKGKDRRVNSDATVHVPERRKTKRRRQIDPTTCEREYSDAEIEFMHALDEYKRASGRMFPTCSEILEVLRGLGYQQVAQPSPVFNGQAQEDSTPNESKNDQMEYEPIEQELETQVY